MAGVLRPRGPHSTRIYWRRRVVLALAAVVAVLLLWSVASGRSEAGPSAGANRNSPSNGTGSGTSPHGTQGNDGPGSAAVATPHSAGRPTAPPPHLAPPSGPCTPRGVSLHVQAADTATGRSTAIRLVFESLSTPACTLAVAPGRIEVRIVSKSSVVWSTTDCPDAFPAKQLVVRAGQPATYVYTWDARASVLGCHGTGKVVKPGQYWVEAALIGAAPARSAFTITPV